MFNQESRKSDPLNIGKRIIESIDNKHQTFHICNLHDLFFSKAVNWEGRHVDFISKMLRDSLKL